MADELDTLGNDELKIGFSALKRGELYPILSVERTEATIYGKKVKGLKAKILDGDIHLYTWLPKKFAEISDDLFNTINAVGDTDSKFTTCYYGTVQSGPNSQAFIGRIHRPNDGMNQKLFSDISKVMMKFNKRPIEDDVSDVNANSKVPKMDK